MVDAGVGLGPGSDQGSRIRIEDHGFGDGRRFIVAGGRAAVDENVAVGEHGHVRIVAIRGRHADLGKARRYAGNIHRPKLAVGRHNEHLAGVVHDCWRNPIGHEGQIAGSAHRPSTRGIEHFQFDDSIAAAAGCKNIDVAIAADPGARIRRAIIELAGRSAGERPPAFARRENFRIATGRNRPC